LVQRHGSGMRRKIFLVFRDAFQHGTRLLHFFVEFHQKQFIDVHVDPRGWFPQKYKMSGGWKRFSLSVPDLKSCVPSYRFFFHPFLSASVVDVLGSEQPIAESQELRADLCLVLNLSSSSFSTAGDTAPKPRPTPSPSRANQPMTGCCASIRTL